MEVSRSSTLMASLFFRAMGIASFRLIERTSFCNGGLELPVFSSAKERLILYKNNIDKIQKMVLGSFQQLLRKESLVTGLTLDPKTYALEIIGAGNGAVDVQRLSAGERQLLAVSLLWGLAQASDRPLPAIIDTPLGRLDTTHRTHLVKRYFPYASHQVLLLSTDEEINKKYYKMIKPWISKSYHLEFNESDQSTTIKNGYFW